jgi:hypothetical protein
MASETIEAQGHLIDSGLLSAIFDKIIEQKASYEVLTFNIGKTNDDASQIRMRITAPDKADTGRSAPPADVVRRPPGARARRAGEAGGKGRCVPDDFYSTTNHRTQVRIGGQWVDVDKQRMDAVIVVDGDKAECRKLRDVKAGEPVICGHAASASRRSSASATATASRS